MLTILVFKGLSLDGAGEGIKFYVGRFEIAALTKPELWKDAVYIKYHKIFCYFKKFLFNY